jgi:hypothetical protein
VVGAVLGYLELKEQFVYVVFGCQENGSEHRSVCMLCLVCKKVKENNRKRGFKLLVGVLWGKVVEVSVCVVFGWQESERK